MGTASRLVPEDGEFSPVAGETDVLRGGRSALKRAQGRMKQRRGRCGGLLCGCLFALMLVSASERVLAGTLPGNLNQWACAAYFGTGWYQAGGNQDVFVLQLAPR